jgi:hypothetical protein
MRVSCLSLPRMFPLRGRRGGERPGAGEATGILGEEGGLRLVLCNDVAVIEGGLCTLRWREVGMQRDAGGMTREQGGMTRGIGEPG